MLRNVIFAMVILFFTTVHTVEGNSQAKGERRNEITSIEGLPFCVFVLNNFYDKGERERTVDVLMEPSRVTESNLYLLFSILSEKFREDPTLIVWVNTDVSQLAPLATGKGGSGPPQTKSVLQLAYYRRTQTVELFRYNPNYPMAGEKTVIIKGKED